MPTNATVRIRSPRRELVLIDRPPARSLRRTSRAVDTIHEPGSVPSGKAGIIYDVSDPQPPPSRQTANGGRAKVHPWSRPSPWWYGLAILLAIAGILATQAPRAPTAASTREHAPGPTPSTALPVLSGPTYTQAMVAGRNFIGADLRGARMMHLDLRGKDFQGANAAGAIFADSFLNGADFSNADLRGADLRDTCLRGANLTEAQLEGADFTDADVTGAKIASAAKTKIVGWMASSSSSVCPGGLAIELYAYSAA